MKICQHLFVKRHIIANDNNIQISSNPCDESSHTKNHIHYREEIMVMSMNACLHK